jgi:ribokinase
MANILVIGSAVLDYVSRVPNFPSAGESIFASDLKIFPGGKGANQAVSAARLGAKVTFAGSIGNDVAGQTLRNALEANSVNHDHLLNHTDTSSGSAFITLDSTGQNQIVVSLGANESVTPQFAQQVTNQVPHDVLLLQCEIPLVSILAAAKASDQTVILNPAPLTDLPDEIYRHITILTPNEHEANLSTHSTPENAANFFHDKGVKNVIITLGSKGVFVSDGIKNLFVPAPKVNVIDTVGAGDCFNGALAVAIAKGINIFQSAKFATECATLSVTKLGAQSGSPRLDQLPESVRHHLDSQQAV